MKIAYLSIVMEKPVCEEVLKGCSCKGLISQLVKK
jgi:hypothetical protein